MEHSKESVAFGLDISKPRKYKVLMHNDDYTSMDFVIEALMKVFHKTEVGAVAVMQHIHNQGIGVCGIYIKEIAETKVTQATEMARASKFPLKVTMEPEE
jgi:ATP-dependent Clp protease adaptor protein ClpS